MAFDNADVAVAKRCVTLAKQIATNVGGDPEAGQPVPGSTHVDALTFELLRLEAALVVIEANTP